MMASELKLQIVSPESVFLSVPVTQVVLPGVDGEFAVRAQHSLLCAQLMAGVIKVTTLQGEKHSVFIMGGFANVTADTCTLLVESPAMVSDLSLEVIEKKIQTFLADHGAANEETLGEEKSKALFVLKSQHQALIKNAIM